MKDIYLLPLGNTKRALVEELRATLEETMHAPVHVGEFAIELSRFYDDARGQYNSTQLLLHLKAHYARPLHPRGRRGKLGPKTVGVIAYDLFTPILTYVFGEAELGGDVAVVSYHRLDSERYGLPPQPALLSDRLHKEALHELGHTFGLVHCTEQACVMHASTYVEDIDVKGGSFCEACLQLIDQR